MDKNTEFKWNDKLVQDYIQFYAASYAASVAYFNSDETLEKFKQSKSKKEEPQWEILEFKNLRSGIVYVKKDNGKFNSGNGLDWDLEKFDIKDHEIINSVKRFPDNTVWSVDMVTEHGIITAFKIVGSTMVAEIKNNIFPYDYPLYLSELKAPKEEQVPISIDDREMFSINDIGSCYSSPKDSPLYNQFIIELYQLLCKKINNQSLNK